MGPWDRTPRLGYTRLIKGRGGPRWTTFSCSCSVVVQAPAQPVRWCVVCKARSGLAIWVGLLFVPRNGQPSGFNMLQHEGPKCLREGLLQRPAMSQQGPCKHLGCYSTINALRYCARLASKMRGFRLRFWSCFLGSFLHVAVRSIPVATECLLNPLSACPKSSKVAGSVVRALTVQS